MRKRVKVYPRDARLALPGGARRAAKQAYSRIRVAEKSYVLHYIVELVTCSSLFH